jgi:hypothetical protein
VTIKPTLSLLLKIAFLGLLLYFCLQFFIPHWESLQLSNRLENLSPSWILAALIFTLVYYLLGFLIWVMVLHSLGSQPNLTMTIRAYILSLLPKYIPGKFLAHGLRAQLSTRAGIPITTALKSLLLEAMFALGSAAAVSIPGAIFYHRAIFRHVPTWMFVASGMGIIALVAVRRFGFNGKAPFSFFKDRRSFTAYLKISLLYLLLWLVSGVAHWCLANALNCYGLWALPHLVVAASASWALGFLSFIAPAGLGVREAVLYFFVGNWMEQADVILFVTLSRLLMFGAEVFLTLVYVLYVRFAQQTETAVIE